MGALFRVAIDICLFRKGPQDLPYSQFLLYLTVAIYGIASLLLLLLSTDLFNALLQLLVEVSLVYSFTWGTLKLGNLASRITQTVTALFITDALITLIAIPVVIVMISDPGIKVFSWLMLGMMLWHWLIVGHIFRHALSLSFAFGLCLALMYIIGSYQIMALLFSS